MTLGKTYRQEGALSWGYLTPPDDVKAEHVRLTQRSSRARPGRRFRCLNIASLRSSRSSFHLPIPSAAASCSSDLPYRLFLDSAAQGARLGRYSFLTADPVAVVWSKGSRTECVDFHRRQGTRHAVEGDALDAIRALLAPHASEPVPGLPPFQGGAAGYLAYDWGRALERLPAPRHDDLALARRGASACTTGCSRGITTRRARG